MKVEEECVSLLRSVASLISNDRTICTASRSFYSGLCARPMHSAAAPSSNNNIGQKDGLPDIGDTSRTDPCIP